MMKKACALVLATALTVVGTACSANGSGGSESDKKPTINIAQWPAVSPPLGLMKKRKMIEKKGYKVNWITVKTALPGASSAMASGKIDFVYPNALTAMIIFAKSQDTARFVGRAFYNTNNLVVRNGSGIKNYKQTVNKKIAMVGKKTAATILYEIALKRHGLKPNRNKYFTSGTGPSLVGSMASGATKVAASYEPYSASMERKDIGHILYTASDMLGFDEPGDGAVVRTKFAKQHPKAVVDVLRATFDATNIVKKDPSAAVKPVANFAKVDEATVKDIYSRKDLIPSSYVPHRKHIVKAAKLAQDAGFAPKGVNLPKFVKNKFVVTRYAKKASAEK